MNYLYKHLVLTIHCYVVMTAVECNLKWGRIGAKNHAWWNLEDCQINGYSYLLSRKFGEGIKNCVSCINCSCHWDNERNCSLHVTIDDLCYSHRYTHFTMKCLPLHYVKLLRCRSPLQNGRNFHCSHSLLMKYLPANETIFKRYSIKPQMTNQPMKTLSTQFLGNIM